MIITDREGVVYEEGDLQTLMESGDLFTSFDSGLMRSGEMFMVIERSEHNPPFSDYRTPLFCNFKKRLETDVSKPLRGGLPDYTPWLGAQLHVHDTTGDREDTNPHIPLAFRHPHRWGSNYDFLVTNGIKFHGLDGRESHGGKFYDVQTGSSTFNAGHMGNVVLPSYHILRVDPQLQPDPENRIKTLDVMCSHMFVGFNSIVKGLEGFGFDSLREFFERYFHETPEYEAKLRDREERSRTARTRSA